jgi:hypothetical protein
MANLFNTLRVGKNVDDLTQSDLNAIVRRLETKLEAAKKGPAIGGTGAIELDLEKARSMLNNFGNKPRVSNPISGSTEPGIVRTNSKSKTTVSAKTYEKDERRLQKLRSMANDPSVSAGEAKNAKSLIEKLESKQSTRVVTEEITEKAAKVVTQEVTEDAEKKAFNRLSSEWRHGSKLGRLAVVAVAAAGIADIAMNAGEKRHAREQQEQQRARQQSKDKKSRQYQYAGTGYAPDTFGSFVQDMFNQRTGHYKMGNAKFK